jgi:hypothetical protein
MEFGSEDDFVTAIAELRWLENIGLLDETVIREVARKYNFPVAFMKAGLKGLSFPDDRMIKTSKWFPVMYSWDKQDEVLVDFRKEYIDYVKSRRDFLTGSYLLVGLLIAQGVLAALLYVLSPDSYNRLIGFFSDNLALLEAVVSVAIGFIITLWTREDGREQRVMDGKNRLTAIGLAGQVEEIIHDVIADLPLAFATRDAPTRSKYVLGGTEITEDYEKEYRAKMEELMGQESRKDEEERS